jgi:hypothetical protein
MRLEQVYASGAEEWACPTCGRRLVMQWPPAYKRIILEPGDEQAVHAGGKGGLRMASAEVSQGEERPAADAHPGSGAPAAADLPEPEGAPIADELRPWLKWLRDLGLDE